MPAACSRAVRSSPCCGLLLALVCATILPAPRAAAQPVDDAPQRSQADRRDSDLPPAPTRYMGRRIARTMHYLGAEWLVRDSREREEASSRLMAALPIEPGQTVCDLGCGNGYYTLKLAQRVGPRGRVWAVDIQPEMLKLLEERAEARGVPTIRPQLGTPISPNLPAGQIDLVLLVDVYHEFSHPRQMLAEIRDCLQPTGQVALVEYRAEDERVPIKPLHKMSQPQVMKEFAANGFKLVGQFDELPWQHVFFFARDDSPLEEVELQRWSKRTDAEAEAADR